MTWTTSRNIAGSSQLLLGSGAELLHEGDQAGPLAAAQAGRGPVHRALVLFERGGDLLLSLLGQRHRANPPGGRRPRREQRRADRRSRSGRERPRPSRARTSYCCWQVLDRHRLDHVPVLHGLAVFIVRSLFVGGLVGLRRPAVATLRTAWYVMVGQHPWPRRQIKYRLARNLLASRSSEAVADPRPSTVSERSRWR